jgi:hypothetical protein
MVSLAPSAAELRGTAARNRRRVALVASPCTQPSAAGRTPPHEAASHQSPQQANADVRVNYRHDTHEAPPRLTKRPMT